MFSFSSSREKQPTPRGEDSPRASSESLLFSDPKAGEYIHDLVLGFVHKHNNFLTITQGFTDLLLSEAEDEATKQSLETVSASARNAVNLNAKVIACASADQPQREAVDLRAFLNERESKLRLTCSDKKVQLSLEGEDSPTSLSIDPLWLDLLLDELLANANEAEECSEVSLRLVHSSSQGSPCIQIINNGVPIEADVVPRAFSPFYSTKDRTHLGIGLTRAGFLAEKMGCRITLQSGANGTKAEVRLPSIEAKS